MLIMIVDIKNLLNIYTTAHVLAHVFHITYSDTTENAYQAALNIMCMTQITYVTNVNQ